MGVYFILMLDPLRTCRFTTFKLEMVPHFVILKHVRAPGGGALPYMGYIGMCRCEGYGFQAVYSRIGYINESVWV